MQLEGWLGAVAGWGQPIEQLESLVQMATGKSCQPSDAPQESVDSTVSAGCGLSLLYKAEEAIGSHSYCPLQNQTLCLGGPSIFSSAFMERTRAGEER